MARDRAARVFVVVALVTQAFFLVRGYWDPHKHFAFQPFPDSAEYKAAIVRVTRDGRRVPIDQPWSGYVWADLVRSRGLRYPGWMHHADSGIASTLVFLQKALDWVADHTPRDTETRYFEAQVEYLKNTRGPFVLTLRSADREEVAP